MTIDDLPFSLSSDNNLTLSNIHREDDVAITTITSVTASLLDDAGATISGSTITCSVTADPATYRGVFPSTITLTVGQEITVAANIIADGLTRLITRPVKVINT